MSLKCHQCQRLVKPEFSFSQASGYMQVNAECETCGRRHYHRLIWSEFNTLESYTGDITLFPVKQRRLLDAINPRPWDPRGFQAGRR